MGKILPNDIINAMKKKYGMRGSEIEKAYIAYWRVVSIYANENKPYKVKDITDGDIPIPHIGKLLLKKKIFDYVQRNTKIQKRQASRKSDCDGSGTA